MKKSLLMLIFILIFHSNAYGEVWKLTAYTADKRSCGKYADGYTASGKKVKYGMIACNWLREKS